LTPELIPQDFLRAAIQQERAKRLEALHNGEKLEEASSVISIPAPTVSAQEGKGKEKEGDEDFVETLF